MPSSAGTSSRSSSSRFATSAVLKKVTGLYIAARSIEAGNNPVFDWIVGHNEEDRYFRRGGLYCERGFRTATGYEDGYAALDQLGCKCWQAVKVAIRPPVLDRHVLCHDDAGFERSLFESPPIGE